jgi:hypothetical protein
MHRLLLATALLVASAAADEFTDRVSKTVDAQPGQTLRLTADYGHVNVQTADVAHVKIEVHRTVRTDSEARAKQIFNDFELTAANNNGVVEVNGSFREGWKPGHWRERRGDRNVCMSRNEGDADDHVCLEYARELREHAYTITLPRKFHVNVETRAGHVEVADVDGNLDARTRGGHVDARAVTGTTHIHTAGGHIQMHNSGGPATLKTAGGHIEVGDVGGDLIATTAGGHIDTGKVNGSVKAKTAGGHITIAQATGAIDAKTVGGGITARFAGQPKEDSRIETRAGSVKVQILGDLKLDVDAYSTNGRVYSEYDLESDDDSGRRRSYSARLNGGGPKLTIQNSHGTISLSRYRAEF